MAKAVLVTEDNKDTLAIDFNIDEDEILEMIGMYIVADFGAEAYEVINEINLDRYFTKTGVNLQNDFFEVVYNDVPYPTPYSGD